MNNSSLLFGVMSGTSLDGIDIVLINQNNKTINIIDFIQIPYNENTKKEFLALHTGQHSDLEHSIRLSLFHAKITANGIKKILKKNKLQTKDIKCIGYHGQTIRHYPKSGYSIQLGNANLLAELTNITVVSDFRNRDIVAGGQGAPLVPAFHNEYFFKKNKNRVIINIGGISNITYLPVNKKITGFDCGPGNILLDHWIKIHHNKNFDHIGRWAKSGKLIKALLLKLQKDSFFKKIPPKSTGRELFNIDWLNKFYVKNYPPEDIQRTLLELTVVTINNAIKMFCSSVDEIYICGGGSKNKFLIERLEEITGRNIDTTDKLNIPSQQVEAIAFAWLAKKCIQKKYNNSPTITGASGPRILGTIHYS
jgi:anhydro-N-acetylmuramic acid kinase